MPRALARRFHENSVGETDDWFTPREIFDALGLKFDLDPAHPGVGTPHCRVPALKIYTRADDGLAQPWFGLVFINPPFGVRNAHLPWMRKFFAHGNGIMIVRAYTSSAWWHEEMSKAELILFPRGKTKFVRPDGSIGTAPGHGVVLVSMGTVACDALQASGLGMLWDQRAEHQHRFEVSREKSPVIINKEAEMAKSKITKVTQTEETEKTAASIIIPPITVGNPAPEENGTPLAIAKPNGEFDLSKFKSKLTATVANVETLTAALPVHNMAAARDYARLHPNVTEYWSDTLCFVEVPIKGQKHSTLHLIDEDLATQFLDAGDIKRFRLVLATKPYEVFFLCEVPTENLDNSWNDTNLEGCEKAKTQWTKATSRKREGIESYKITFARDPDAFPEPNWPKQSLAELIARAFAGRMIETADHPALLRKIGAKQSLS